MISRRRFVEAVTVGLLGAPLPAQAQRPANVVPRVGILAATSQANARAQLDAFREGLRALGYVPNQTIGIEERWADGREDRFGEIIDELLAAKVDVLVIGSAGAARRAKQRVTATPVVFAAVTDPIGSGIVASLARPGGNITGTSLVLGEDLAGKWVELLRDAVPRIATVAVLGHPDHPMHPAYMTAIRHAARGLGLTVQTFDARDAAEIDRALALIAKARPGALIVTASPLFGTHRKRIAQAALPSRIPTIGYDREFAVDGCLLAYGPSINESYRRAAAYVDRILRGARPGDLPVEQPTIVQLSVNLRTAKALGLTIPPSLLVRADHVIE